MREREGIEKKNNKDNSSFTVKKIRDEIRIRKWDCLVCNVHFCTVKILLITSLYREKLRGDKFVQCLQLRGERMMKEVIQKTRERGKRER